jgi:undecaprenyl-diphosphatase
MAAAVLALGVAVTASSVIAAIDTAAGELLRTQWLPWITAISWRTSALAATDLILPLTAGLVVLMAAARHWHGALTLAAAVLATQGVVQLVKLVVARPRPDANGAVAEAGGHSFPSAHSATAVALYATLAFLAARQCRGAARVAVLALGAVVILAVGFSRIQLGAHYPVDVVAGWLVGGALVLASWALIARLVARPATA